MDRVVVIGSGIAGCACAVRLAEADVHVTLVSPFPSERSQSVMAAGGINAVLENCEAGDSVASHIDDTMDGGRGIAGQAAVRHLCEHASDVVEYLERIGTVFTLDRDGSLARRAFGGQTHRRTYYCGSSTGKQIVLALVMEVRRFEARGLIQRKLWSCFHSAPIQDGRCYGAILFDEASGGLTMELADALVVATGGQNALFGKTTGSTQCDGYAVGRLFMQGVDLKNLEFIQYHPTTLETPQKRILVSEAVRGEGGRLFYLDGGERVYFMEEKCGARGNLMPRDVVSQQIAAVGRQVYLDATVLGKRVIDERLSEVRDVCWKYRGIDIAKEPIPVAPSVHFFMGGIAVDNSHETNVENLFAIGECASMYHGANRLGGNSLLSAVYSGWVAADAIAGRDSVRTAPDFSTLLSEEGRKLARMCAASGTVPAARVRDAITETMDRKMGVVRDGDALAEGMADIDRCLSDVGTISYDPHVMMYMNYCLPGLLVLARAALACAEHRTESRGAHVRSDYPAARDDFAFASIVSYNEGEFKVWLDKDGRYER